MSLNARSYLLDAGALALYFAGDDRVKQYLARVTSGKASGFVSDVNLAEFYYKTGQRLGEDTAEARLGLLANSRIEFVSTDREIARAAAKWKLRRPGLSLADCFALASLEKSAEVLLTTDSELKQATKSKGVLFEIAQ